MTERDRLRRLVRESGFRLTDRELAALLNAWRRYRRLRDALRASVAADQRLP